MTERELDAVLKNALLDALKADETQAAQEKIPFQPSISYRRSMRRMTKEPLKWLRDQERPAWKRVLRSAAMIALVISISFGSLMTVPPARAAIGRWVAEWHEANIVFEFFSSAISEELEQYGISDLPTGFVETSRNTLARLVTVTYENDTDEVIRLTYGFMSKGAGSAWNTDACITEDVTVNGLPGQYFESSLDDGLNTLVWFDETSEIHFSLSGAFTKSELLHMAEKISGKN